MNQSIIILSHEEHVVEDNPEHSRHTDELQRAISDLLDDVTELGPISIDSHTAKLGAIRQGWEPGNPCPECESETISVLTVKEEQYTSSKGTFEYQDRGEADGNDVSHICADCTTFLRALPVSH